MKKFLLIIKEHKIIIYSLLIISVLFVGINKIYINKLMTNQKSMLIEKEKLIRQKNDLLNVISNLKKENQILDEGSVTLKDVLIFKTKILDFKNKAVFLEQISNYNEVALESVVPGNMDKSSSHIFKWTINVSVKGTYNQIKNYVDYLNRLPYLININRLELSKHSQKSINTAQITLEVLCR